MSSLLDQASDSIDKFLAENDAFRETCENVFREADKDRNGRLSYQEAASKVDRIFDEIEDALKASGVTVERLTQSKVQRLLEDVDIDGDMSLNKKEFMAFYIQILKLATYNSTRGFFAKHGPEITAALGSVFAMKKIELPEDLKPFVALIAPLVSIAAASLARYGVTYRRKKKVEKELFRAEAFKKQN